MLSGIAASTTPSAASIIWSTDITSDSTVDYGPTAAYGASAAGNTGTAHTVNLAGLAAGTVYHYRVRSKSGPGAFESFSADHVLPLVTNVSSGAPSQTAATITWLTNAELSSNHVVDYGTSTSYGLTQVGTAPNGTSHSVGLTGLSPSTTYHFRVRSTDGTDSATSEDNVFSTAAYAVSPLASLTDAFGSLDSSKWTVTVTAPGDWAQVQGGALWLIPAPNSGASGVWVESSGTYSLLESSATVNALQVVSPSGHINSKFTFHAPGGISQDDLGFWYEGGTLYAYYFAHGAQNFLASTSYQPDAHAWWRIRHSGSTVFWETSRDRSSWTTLAAVSQSAFTFDLGHGILGFNVKGWGAGNPSPGVARFTYLNLAATPISALSDAFNWLDSANWYVGVGTAGSAAWATGGALYLYPEAYQSSGSASVMSNTTYALTGSSIVVKVPQVVSSLGNVNQTFRVAPGPFSYDDEAGFWFESGNLYAYQRAHGDTSMLATLTYSPSEHAWWRLREAWGTVYWDTSPDGFNWTERAAMATSGLSFSPAVVSVYMSANEFGGGLADPKVAQFTRLNAP